MRIAALPPPVEIDQEDALTGFVWLRVGTDGSVASSAAVRWSPGANEATCGLYPRFLRARWERLHPEGAPSALCRCGFRATHRPEPAGLHPPGSLDGGPTAGAGQPTVGRVLGWGRVFADESGWRSRFARLDGIVVPGEIDHAARSCLETAIERFQLDPATDIAAFPGRPGHARRVA